MYISKYKRKVEFYKLDASFILHMFLWVAGLIKVSEWCQVMSDTLNMDLPWRSLRPHIVTLDEETGLVEYYSTFEELKVTNRWHAPDETSNINEALYRHKDNLETIFRAIDKDNSGIIIFQNTVLPLNSLIYFLNLKRNFFQV